MSDEPMDEPSSDDVGDPSALVEELGYEPCTATSKQAKRRCRRRPVPGLSVCVMHGGKSPAAQAKAADVLLVAAAEREVQKLWVGLDAATPVTDPVTSLARMAGALEAAVDVVGGKVNELNHLSAGTGLAQMRGEVVLLERLLGQLRQALEGMARLGIEERRVQLQQQQADFIVNAFKAGLAAVASQLLTPGDKDAMLRAFLGALEVDVRALEAGVSA